MASIEKLILLSGPVATGKTALREVLVNSFGFRSVRSSGYLKQLADRRCLAGERTGLQDLGDELDRLSDCRWLLDDVVRPECEAFPEQRRWLVDAVRKIRQIEHLRIEYGDVVQHIHLVAEEEILRRRYMERNDAIPYETAIQHENEIASRKLILVADLVIDTGMASSKDAAQKIIVQSDLA